MASLAASGSFSFVGSAASLAAGAAAGGTAVVFGFSSAPAAPKSSAIKIQ